MSSDDASRTVFAGGWFRNCHKTARPLCTGLGRAVKRPRSPTTELVPAADQTDDNDNGWDGRFLVHTGFHIPVVSAERRHSGWEAVEKRWAPLPPSPPPQQQRETEKTPVAKTAALPTTESELEGDVASALRPHLVLPPPRLEPDFRLRLVLSPHVAGAASAGALKKWSAVADGVWSGRLGRGVVTGGGQETLDGELGGALATQVESNFRLRTSDEPPAIIECVARGTRTSPANVAWGIQAEDKSAAADPAGPSHRMVISMKTSDERYAEKVNAGMWVATCLWQENEVVYSAYRVM